MSQDHYLDTRKVFSKETIASMSDKDLGLYVFGVFVAHVAAETNSTFESVSQKLTNDPNCLETETIDSVAFASTLRFAARGEPQKAGSLFRADLAKGALSLATLDEVISGRRRQKKTQKPQRSNRVARLIKPIVSVNPSISINDLLKELCLCAEVDEISEDVLWFKDGTSINVNLLPSRLSRMKKKIRKEQ
jgi:hypothetical protein